MDTYRYLISLAVLAEGSGDPDASQKIYQGAKAVDALDEMYMFEQEYVEPFSLWWEVNHYFEDGDYVVMQYTGVKDKNGKEIFEGDILKTRGSLFEIHYYLDSFRLFTISTRSSNKGIISSGCPVRDYNWHLQSNNQNKVYFHGDDCYEVEILGNIYENTELLGETDERN